MKSLRSCLLGTGTAALILGCGGAEANHDHPVAPPPPTSSTIDMSILSGANASDTIDAVLRQPLVVELRDGSGALVAGQAVLFESVQTKDSTGAPRYMAGFPAGTGQIATVAQSVTNGQGQAGVPVVLGRVAGPAQIAISVQGSDAKQVVGILVLPGHPTRFSFLPADTGVVVGGAARLRAAGIDRAGNFQMADVAYAPSPHPEIATVSSSGTVTGVAPGSITVTASIAGFTASGTVEVVPNATIAAYYGATVDGDSNAIATVNLDGTHRQWLIRGNGATAPVWDPPAGIIYTASGPGDFWGRARLYYLTPGSAAVLLNPAVPNGSVSELWPAYNSATGEVFYGGVVPGDSSRIYIRAPDGTITQIAPQGNMVSASNPSPSPDGSKIAYVAPRTSGDPSPVVWVYDRATKTNSSWSVDGDDPRWSPKGDRIAYVQPNSGHMDVVNADGTGARVLSSALFARAPFTWSPDGAWIVARMASGFGLINTATGETLTLNYFGSYDYPAWR